MAYNHYQALYHSGVIPDHVRSFGEPAILAQGLDAAVVHEDGAYLVMRDVSIAYHKDGTTPKEISGVVRGTYLSPSRALDAFNVRC